MARPIPLTAGMAEKPQPGTSSASGRPQPEHIADHVKAQVTALWKVSKTKSMYTARADGEMCETLDKSH